MTFAGGALTRCSPRRRSAWVSAIQVEQTLQRPVDFADYLTLAWIISSLATVGGAIGSGLEDEETVRAAAYGYHPEPGALQDERDG
jgi:hypothetical protein